MPTYEPRSVYEYEDVPRAPGAPVVPIVIPVPSPLPTTPVVVHTTTTADGAIYALTYRVTQRPEAVVGVLETCHLVTPRRG